MASNHEKMIEWLYDLINTFNHSLSFIHSPGEGENILKKGKKYLRITINEF